MDRQALMATRFAPETPGLVAVLKHRADLDYALTGHWYRIPVRTAPVDLEARRWVGFYLSEAFGTRAGTVPYWAKIEGVTVAPRVALLPAEVDHPRAQDPYFRLALGPLEKRAEPIYCQRRRPIVFIPSVWAKFQAAREINELFHESPLEDRLWTEFQRVGLAAERQWFTRTDRQRYCLDFALFCPERNIDVECDGDAWHASPEQAQQDNERNNTLEQHGWHVLRFNTAQLTQKLPACLRQVTTTIRRCGGCYLPDGTVWDVRVRRAALLPEPSPVPPPEPTSDPPRLPKVGRLLGLPRQSERRAALADLQAHHGIDDVAQALVQIQDHGSARLRERAVWCLGELGPHPGIPEALAAWLAKETNPQVRRLAYSACAKLRSGEVEEAILARLEKEEKQVLQYALKALAQCGSARAVAPIRRVLQREQPIYVVRAAEAALRQCQRWW